MNMGPSLAPGIFSRKIENKCSLQRKGTEGKPVRGSGDCPALCSHAPGFRAPLLALPEGVTRDRSVPKGSRVWP